MSVRKGLPFLKSLISTLSGLVDFLAPIAELCKEREGVSVFTSEPCDNLEKSQVTDPSGFLSSTPHQGFGDWTASVVLSKSARFSKTSGSFASGTSERCSMPGILSISWVKTVEEVDCSSLNMSSEIGEGVPELVELSSWLLMSVSKSTLAAGRSGSKEMGGFEAPTSLGTRLKGSKQVVKRGALVTTLAPIP